MPPGGARPGAGRPKGKKDPETIERERQAALLQRRRLRVVDRIFNAQLALAEGTTFVYEVVQVGTAKHPKEEHRVVTDPERIARFLDRERLGAADDPNENYMYITTEKPDGKMIADIFDRAFGRAPQAIEMKHVPADNETRDHDDSDIDRELAELDREIAEATEREKAGASVGETPAEGVN
jgi:hypothetical protein